MGSGDEAEQSVTRPCRQIDDRSERTCELTSSVFQNPILLPWRTVMENVLLSAEVQGFLE